MEQSGVKISASSQVNGKIRSRNQATQILETPEVGSWKHQRWDQVPRRIDWLIIYCFTSHSRILHLYGDACCDTWPRFFRSHPKDCPIQSPLTTHKGVWRTYSNLDPHGSPFSRLLRHTRGCGGPILTRILMGHLEGAMQIKLHGRLWLSFRHCVIKPLYSLHTCEA
jgi:hypothetical protein